VQNCKVVRRRLIRAEFGVFGATRLGIRRLRTTLGVAALGVACLACDPSAVTDRLPWHDDGVWLQGDIHVHHLQHPEEWDAILGAARDAGLDFVASTEHADITFLMDPAGRIPLLRLRYPELVLLAGIEWNVPGAGHAVVIVERSPEEWSFLERFFERFDRFRDPSVVEGRSSDDTETWGSLDEARQALRWLAERAQEGQPRSVVYLCHPSREGHLSDEEITDLVRSGMQGVEASPGHQKWDPPGTPRTIDRYEPFVANVGGGYDRLSAEGLVAGLAAVSDIHDPETGFYPGVFSRTLVFCPERSSAGIVSGLAAGSTVAVLGGIVRRVETFTGSTTLADRARIGERLRVPAGSTVSYRLALDVPATDYLGGSNRIDEVEVISDWDGRVRVVHTFEAVSPGEVELETVLPTAATERPGGFFLRARGRRRVGGEGNDRANADWLFYTGATRVEVVRR
jgi:hypothetical protein